MQIGQITVRVGQVTVKVMVMVIVIGGHIITN